MNLKRLKSVLQDFDVFESPNIALEQYTTTPDVAANFLNVANAECDAIDGKMVADLGCGCGTLAIGAALLDAGFCVGFEIDDAALQISERNREYADVTNIDFIQCDVADLTESKWHKAFDTVIMNPPFGTKNSKGIDVMFLNTAVSLARHSVFSLHKSSTIKISHRFVICYEKKPEFMPYPELKSKKSKNFLTEIHLGIVAEALNVKMRKLYELKFELPKSYSRHKSKTADIDVHLLQFIIS